MKFHHLWILSIVLVPFSSSSAKRYGGGSSYSSGSKPSGYNSKPGPSPTTNSKNKPSSGGGQYGPTYSTEKSYNNPNPAYKPATPAGAPTLASGGGGYNSRGGGGYSGGSLAGAAIGGMVLGSFLYGGMYSSPGCRGGMSYSSSYCNYGTSTSNHPCPSQIPICEIPQSIQEQWYLGSTPQVEVIADKATCSSSAPNLAPSIAITTETLGATGSTAVPTPADVVIVTVDGDENVTTATTARAGNLTSTDDNDDEEDGDDIVPPNNNTFTLADCMEAVIQSGTCDDSKRFTYDEISGKCQCCNTGADVIPWEYSSAIYVYSSSNPLTVPPQYCVSGSTMYYPTQSTTNDDENTASLTDQTYTCQCGDCTQCGNPQVSYMDWSGPFVVPTEIGETAVSPVSDKPLYDPVETCTCNAEGAQCPQSGGNVRRVATATATAASLFLVLLL